MPFHFQTGRHSDRRRLPARWLRLSPLVVAVWSLVVGCELPRDPEETLNRVRSGVLRVGVTPHGDWVESEEGSPPTGIEPALVEDFARQLGAEIQWSRGSEAQVLKSLEAFELDLVVGGLTDETLWSDRVALSRPYVEAGGSRHVMAVAPGENRFLLQLDRFLKSREDAIARQVRESTGHQKVKRP